MLLLGPTLGAVIGTSIAVSELSSVTIAGKQAAAAPSVSDVLWPAIAGGVGGVAILALVTAAWGAFSYFRSGDDAWHVELGTLGEARILQLVCTNEVPVDPIQLGSMECVVRRPAGDFDHTDIFSLRPGAPYGMIATGAGAFNEPGQYEVRWSATEHRARLHEVARAKLVIQ